mgnify:FL=1
MISSDLACDCAAFTVYASYTRLTRTAMCLSRMTLKRSSTLSRSLVVTPSRHSHWSQKSMRIGYSEFCSCYASRTPSSLTVSMLWISIVMISTPAKSIVFAAHSLVCVWNYMIMYPPESDVFAHAAEDLREQRRVLRVEEVAVEGVLAERRVHQQALHMIFITHAYQQTTIAHQHVHVGVVALRVRVTDLTHLLQRLHGHGRVGDVFEHLVALLQLVALRGVLAQRLLALWVSASLLAHLLLQEGPHDALRVLQLTSRYCRYHQQVLRTAHRHLVRLESRREGASSVRLLAVALDAVEEDVLHARHVLALQLWVTWLEETHLLVGLRDVLLQEQHDGGQRN